MTALLTVGDPSPAATVGLPLGSLYRYTAAVTVVAVLVVAGRAVWQRRGEPVTHLLPGLGALALVAAAALTAVTQSVRAVDALSAWVLGDAHGDVENAVLALATPVSGAPGPALLPILLGAFATICAGIQVVLLVCRGAALVVLTGLLPLLAPATSTETGRATFRRALTWIAALVLFQPVAALIDVVGLAVAPDPQASPVLAAITGVTALALAVAALPALRGVLRPVVVAATSTGGPRRR